MALYKEFHNVLHQLKFCDRNRQCFLLKKMASFIQYTNKADLQGLLDFINATHDIELQVKLFSILSVHLINNDTNIDIFITFNPMYDAIDRILSKNLPRKTTVLLNFLTLLLQSDTVEEFTSRRSTLRMHAQNQIRASGCLATMSDIFTCGMTYQDTWRALCRCLAEACSNSERNQNYCSHLISKCIKIWNTRNMETLPVLQSLIYNNKRNVHLFLQCDGMSLFKSEVLQYESSLQLLSAIVQTSTEATIFAQDMNILQQVHDLLRICGPYTLTGQWATVILYYADAKIKGYEKEQNHNLQNTINKSRETATQNLHMDDDNNDTSFFRNVIKEIVQWHGKEEAMYKNILVSNNTRNKEAAMYNNIQVSNNTRNKEEPMYHNIQVSNNTRNKEEAMFNNIQVSNNTKSKEKAMYNNILISNNTINKRQRRDSMICDIDTGHFDGKFRFRSPVYKRVIGKKSVCPKQAKPTDELSFTFLNKYFKDTLPSNKSKVPKNTNEVRRNATKTNNQYIQVDLTNPQISFTHTSSLLDVSKFFKERHTDASVLDLNDFKPNFVSTPKHRKNIKETNTKKLTNTISVNSRKGNGIKKRTRNAEPIQKLADQTLRERIFKAINNSCTAVMNSVTSIFKSKKTNNSVPESNDKSNDLDKCSYSFTEYMRKRDADVLLGGTTHENIHQSFELDSCGSCNNTDMLKNKMLKDKFLKETVRKLKVGINMYGCDFTKISKTMSPHEDYMTPAILYNLYRKLIMK